MKSLLAAGSPGKWPPRFPPAAAGIQVNHCKNPRCANFAVPPKPESKRGSAATRAADVGPGDYRVVAAGKWLPQLKCLLCGETVPMQSNLAIAEELMRISDYLEPVLPRCPNSACAMSSAPAHASNCTRFGTNAHGTPRYKCVECGKAFAFGGRTTKRQRHTHRNRDIFQHLMNAMPLRRIIKVLDISPTLLYDRINFLHSQCQMFAGERERALMERPNLGKRYISVDRQKLVVNWSNKKTRKNTILLSIASADQATGYVFAANINFDAELDSAEIEKDMKRFADDKLPKAFRRYARVWLPADWDAAATRATGRSKGAAVAKEQRLAAAIEATYEAALDREDIEDGEGPSAHSRTPVKGMLLHEQTVMNAHVQLVSRMLCRAQKLRFFVDQESGLRAAIMAAVPDRIRNRTADAFYVKVVKDFTVDEKRSMVRRANAKLKKFAEDAGVDEKEAQILIAREELTAMTAHGKWEDRWFKHPVADMREPEKSICWLTDVDAEEVDADKREGQLNHYARLYLKATLTAIDRFFMQVRRGITLAERGVISASADRRLWFGKNAYNPDVLVKLLGIFRTYFNYCEVGEDGQTPAMRLGLARGPVAPEDIIYFSPQPPARRRAPGVVAAKSHREEAVAA